MNGCVIGVEGKVIMIAFKEAFARDRILRKGKELVESKINDALKVEGYRIQCLLLGAHGVKAPSPSPSTQPINTELLPKPVPVFRDTSTMLKEVLDIFGGVVVNTDDKNDQI